MSSLSQQRCFNHATREAVARCPECKQFFCRECITEHDDRVVCAVCLQKLTRRPPRRPFGLAQFWLLAQGVVGFLVLWYFFFLIGNSLLKLPDSFHAGTLWQANWMDAK